MSLTKKIPNVRKGTAPSLLNAELANMLIDKINKMTNIKISRGGQDAVYISDNEIMITLQPQQIDAELVSFWVCINGEAVRKKFYISRV